MEKFIGQKKLFFLDKFVDKEKYSSRKKFVYINIVVIFNYLGTFLCYTLLYELYTLVAITQKVGYYYKFDLN